MNRLRLLACMLTFAASAAAQQRSTEDGAGWYGIMLTPVGAFPVIEASRANASDDSARISFVASRWSIPASTSSQYSAGATYRPRSGAKSRYEFTLGLAQPSKFALNDMTLMLGAGLGGPLWRNEILGLDWKVSAGFGHSRANGGYEYLSLVGQLPVRWTRQLANKSALSAFGSVGYGIGGVGDYADAEYGLRALASLGGGWTSPAGVGLHVGVQQVMMEVDGETAPLVAGLSLSIRR